jgi:DNA-binding CsgD family transcriptional regulator
VRKHLENIYAKLGVSSRTAAAARFLATLDAETSAVP